MRFHLIKKLRLLARDHRWYCSSGRGINFLCDSEAKGRSRALQKALSDAEKIVGFPTTFLSLRALLSDEFGGLAIHLRKLINTKHPLLNTARGILLDSKNYMQTRGLVMLLISKAADNKDTVSVQTREKLQSLAEITELIHLAFLVHRGVIDSSQIMESISKTDADLGNKLAVLGGDFMLASACVNLAKLENTEIVDIISASIADMSLSLVMLPENIELLDRQILLNIPTNQSEWVKAIKLANGSLLAKACQSALLLNATTPELLDAAERFSYNLVLAQQAKHDMMRFTSLEMLNQNPNFSCICSLPAILMAQEKGGRSYFQAFLEDNGNDDVKIQAKKLYNLVIEQKHLLKLAEEISYSYVNAALRDLQSFPLSRARNALESIVLSVSS